MARSLLSVSRSKKILFVIVVLSCTVGLPYLFMHGGESSSRSNQGFSEQSEGIDMEPKYAWNLSSSVVCDRWAVVAPSDSEWASEAVRRQVRLLDWCLVVVFEREPSSTYDPGWYPERDYKAIVYLTKDKDITVKEFLGPRTDVK